MSYQFEIGTQPEVDGQELRRLIITENGKAIDSVLVDRDLTIDCVIEKLAVLSFRMKERKRQSLLPRRHCMLNCSRAPGDRRSFEEMKADCDDCFVEDK